jgi:Ribbon-helix-helix protein, copG family
MTVTTEKSRRVRFAAGKRPLQVVISASVLAVVDRAAAREHLTRSEWVRQAVLAHIPVDLYTEVEP